MKRFRNILYILDTDDEKEDALLATVQNLARLNKARVSIIKVVPEGFVDNLGKLFSSILQDLIDVQGHHHSRILQIQLSNPGWKDLDVKGEILTGRDFVTVIGKVLREGHDLVVKARKNRSGTDPLAMHLFRKCPCPVWIIAGPADRSLKKVLAAVDLRSQRPEGRELNVKIIQIAHSLAQREQIEAHFLHVWHLQYEQSMRGARFRVSDEEIDSIKHELVDSRAAAFKDLVSEADVSVDPQYLHLVEGDPGEIIEQQLTTLQADVLVMGTVARTGLPGLLIGNRAEEVLSRVQCTVLTVKPDGFISPVTV